MEFKIRRSLYFLKIFNNYIFPKNFIYFKYYYLLFSNEPNLFYLPINGFGS